MSRWEAAQWLSRRIVGRTIRAKEVRKWESESPSLTEAPVEIQTAVTVYLAATAQYATTGSLGEPRVLSSDVAAQMFEAAALLAVLVDELKGLPTATQPCATTKRMRWTRSRSASSATSHGYWYAPATETRRRGGS